MKIFSERFGELRKLKDLKVDELAKKIDYHPVAVAQWEANALEPHASDILAVARFFGVSLDFLLGFSNVWNKMMPMFWEELSRDDKLALLDYRRLSEVHRTYLLRTLRILVNHDNPQEKEAHNEANG